MPNDGKILGMPKAGAVALFAAGGLLLFLWWQHNQSSSSGGQQSQAPRNLYISMPGHWVRKKKGGGANG